jgi:PKD repeat protein
MNGGGSILSWSWNFGDPLSGANNTTTIQNPGHTFTGSGKYKVSLQVTSTSGCTHLWSDTITIYGLPTANFTNSNGCEGGQISFNSSSSIPNGSSIISHAWSFGDGGTSGLANPDHQYLTYGIYNVTLTVVDSIGCASSVVKQVTVNPKPIPAFTYSSGTCDSIPVSFTNLSQMPSGFPGFITRWIWVWDDGTSDTINQPTSPNVSHLFPAGVYSFNVTLVVTTSFGCRDSVVHEVNLIPFPVASFEVVPGTPTCATQPVQFNDLSQTNGGGNITGWLWNFDDPGSGSNNTSPSPSPSHVFASAGIYHVVLRVTNANGCFNADTIPVAIAERPVANFAADTACAGSVTQFTDHSLSTGSTLTSFSWSFGDGGTSTLQSPTHTYTAFGIYNATLTIVNSNGCTHSVTKQVMVSPKPVPAFTFSQTSCVGLPVTFTDYSFIPSGFTNSIKTWIWKFGDGSAPMVINAPASPNLDYTFLGNATSHTVTLIVITTGNCTDSISKQVNSVPSPISGFTHSNATCLGQSVQFTDLSQVNGGGSIQTWNWNFGDPLSGTNNSSTLQHPAHSFTATGNFIVTLTVISANGCVNAHDTIIGVDSLPAANFTFTTVCEGTLTTLTDSSQANAGPTGSIVSYAWDFGDGVTSTLQSPQHTFASYGNYTVTLTIVNSNGCIHSVSKTVVVNPKPIVEFTYSPSGCSGLPVTFYDQSFIPTGFSATITSWEWNFGDGSAPVLIAFPGNPDVTHTFLGGATSHIVRLTVTTSTGCVKYIEKTVTVSLSPIANFAFSTANCIHQPVQFSDLTQTNGGTSLQNWSWNFGDPLSGANNTSSLQNPPHSFSDTGLFMVTLLVTNISGCTHTFDTVIHINPLPVANFTYLTVCEGTPTTFNDASQANAGTTGTIVSYSWNFGDGGTATGSAASHTFASYGTYTVTLTVVNSNGCIHSVSKPVFVNPKAIAEFTYSPSICLGDPVMFYNQAYIPTGSLSYIDQWVWDFGDGTTPVIIGAAGNPNVTHSFAGNSLSHVVRLTVRTFPGGCFSFIEKTVNSVPAPVASFSFSSTACANQPMQFTDLSQTNGGGSIQLWAWNFGDPLSGGNNTATIQNPIHQFTSSTGSPYSVRLIVANSNGCRDTVTVPVTVNVRPVANFTADTVCLGTATPFTDISNPVSGSITTRAWDFGDGSYSSLQNPSHLFASAGTFNVKLTVSNTLGCQKDTIKSILVLGKPVASFSHSSPGCAVDSVQFTDLSSTPHGFIQQWEWNFGDGSGVVTIQFPANQNIKHRFANGGNYNVTLKITTSDGCTVQKTSQVQISARPLVNFTFGNSACPHQPLQFTDLSQVNGGSVITGWSWNFGDPSTGVNNTSTLQNPTHSFSASGTFTVRLIVTNANGCVDSIPNGVKTVTVNPSPVASFSVENLCLGSPAIFTDASTPTGSIATWAWNFDDPLSGANNTSIIQNPTHTFTALGTYHVTLSVTTSNQCARDTMMVVNINPKPIAMFQYGNSCDRSNTLFTSTSTAPNSSIVNWDWDFGDGVTLSGVFPTTSHLYTTSGTHMVKLVVKNVEGCYDSVTLPVLTRPQPVAAFNYTSHYCPAGKVDFTDVSQGVGGASVITSNWVFIPGGPVNSGSNPFYTYTTTNMKYLVTLMVEDNYHCWDTIADSVFVKPGWGFSFRADTVCFGSNTHFTPINLAPGDTLNPVSWDFGDPSSSPNNTSSLYKPTHKFTHPGVFPVKFKVQNFDRCVDSIFLNVKVWTPPQPLFSYSALPCDSVLHFTDSTQIIGDGPIAKWRWTWGDGQSSTILSPPGNTSHKFSTSGIYPVTLAMTTIHGCADSIVKNVQRFPCIQAGFSFADTLCARYKVAFSDTSMPSSGISRWKWSWGDGTPPTIFTKPTSPVYHIYADSGTYTVNLEVQATVNGTAVVDNRVGTVIIRPTPITYFANPPVCLNQITLFRDTSKTYGEPLTGRSWYFSKNPLDKSSLPNPQHLYDTSGIYNVKLVVNNGFGCKDSLTKPTRVYGLPVANYSAKTACSGDSAVFTDISMLADTTIGFWRWSFGDPDSMKDTSNLENPKYRYTATGDYPVRMIVEDHFGCIDTIDSTLTVNQSPVASFTITENVNGMPGKIQLNNKSDIPDGYYWKFPGGTGYPDEESPIVLYGEDGKFEIRLIVTNDKGCIDSTTMMYEFYFDNLYVPNAFVPSSLLEGKAMEIRKFMPKGRNLAEYHIMVFDKWGHMLWESQKISDDTDNNMPVEGWDGTYQGKEMPQDVYMWKINARFRNGKVWEGSDSGTGSVSTMGTVTLLR